ncbi:metallophosphoesterase [Actinospica durhamensis]|uniref:Metallophosphoesterase n=1 Tax=Actinospica durhamensis TaxID=1508375 RepID=A0A941EMA4_9ACTN|nr:metallophosphoesterase [Actinospica durhamensis]MBR7831639.1 metallophosphoesterase [Actinospica durhamensis]
MIDQSAYAVGDVHGCLAPLRDALARGGFVDGDDRWIAGNTRLWFLGDLTDRGPDGVGVIELVMGLQEQAAEAGGEVGCLLGNHELMLLAAHLPAAESGHASAEAARRLFWERWTGNGGKESDSARLTDAHLEWIARLPAMARIGEHLLMHADTLGYRGYGSSVAEVNARVAGILTEPVQLPQIDELTHMMTKRFAFASDDGQAAREFLGDFGGRQIVHGHSPVPLLLGKEPREVTGPLVYAGGYAANFDTGTFLGGPCFVAPLPTVPREAPVGQAS